MKQIKAIVWCEKSQIVTRALIERGVDAVSCDILPCEYPEWGIPHIQDDARNHLTGYDLGIGHPPCTYLSKAGARWLYHDGILDEQRYKHGLNAVAFFMELYNCEIEHLAIENPTPLKIYNLPSPSQDLQPKYFGHAYTKRTLIWLRNLPPLFYDGEVAKAVPLMPSNTGGKKRGQQYHYSSITSMAASRTFQGIAEAMAEQWTNYLTQ